MRENRPGSDDERPPGVDLDGLRSVLEGADVSYAVLFGSYAVGTETPSSDIDVCLRFADDVSRRDRFRRRNRIDAEIQSYADPFVDVSDLEALPDGVALNALRDGVLLYGDADAKAADERRLEWAVAATSVATRSKTLIEKDQ